jgi:hypothetical protein
MYVTYLDLHQTVKMAALTHSQTLGTHFIVHYITYATSGREE